MFCRSLVNEADVAWDDELGGQATFDLARLVHVEARYRHLLELSDSFGDGALLTRHASFRKMRTLLIEHGYQFVPANELPAADVVAPELRLLRALETRTIPFKRLRPVVDSLLEFRPTCRFSDEDLTRICFGNTTSHEGAHALVFEQAKLARGHLEGEHVVDALMAGEGFAMAFELWMSLLLVDQPSRSLPIFFGLNAAQNPYSLRRVAAGSGERLMQLAELAKHHGRGALCLLSAAGFVANLRPAASTVRPQLLHYFMDLSGVPRLHEESARVLVETALALDVDFKVRTARTFFRFNDLEDDYLRVCQRPLEYHFSTESTFHRHVGAAIDSVLESAIETQ